MAMRNVYLGLRIVLPALKRTNSVYPAQLRALNQIKTLNRQTARQCSSKAISNEGASTQATDTHSPESGRKPLGTVDTKMILGFTCEVCKTRNNKVISKQAYTKGVIIVKCDGCSNNHLIADNLGWFTDVKKNWTIEHIMAEKGESVRRLPSESDAWEIVHETLELMKSSGNKDSS